MPDQFDANEFANVDANDANGLLSKLLDIVAEGFENKEGEPK